MVKVRVEISKKKWRKKDKWGSIQYKQGNIIYHEEIRNQMKGALHPGTSKLQSGIAMTAAVQVSLAIQQHISNWRRRKIRRKVHAWWAKRQSLCYCNRLSSGVTKNSGDPGQISKSSRPSPLSRFPSLPTLYVLQFLPFPIPNPFLPLPSIPVKSFKCSRRPYSTNSCELWLLLNFVQVTIQRLRYLGDPCTNSPDCLDGNCSGKIIFF